MIATEAHKVRCTVRGVAAVATFYPDTRTVRICAEGGRCFEELRWPFGWDALLQAVGPTPRPEAAAGVGP